MKLKREEKTGELYVYIDENDNSDMVSEED
jgi:hypothetical protein